MRTLALVGVLVATLAVEAFCGFLPAVNLGPRINGPYNEDGADISPDGQLLIFSSNRPNGDWNYDLWGAVWQNGEWSEPFNLGPQVNTGAQDIAPVFSGDGNTLYFLSNRGYGKGGFDYYQSVWDGSAWGPAALMPGEINTPGDERPGSPSSDGSRFYFSTIVSKDSASPFYSDWNGASWGSPVPIPELSGADYQMSTAIAPLSSRLVISSSHPGGFQSWGYDLWVSTCVNGIWQPLVNLGPNINNVDAEMAAQFSAGGDTLLFVSNRPDGYGGNDIWMAVADHRTDAAERGDLDCNSQINIVDVTRSVDRIFRAAVPPNPCVALPTFDVADVNCDGLLNIIDVVTVIDRAFRGGAVLPACGP